MRALVVVPRVRVQYRYRDMLLLLVVRVRVIFLGFQLLKFALHLTQQTLGGDNVHACAKIGVEIIRRGQKPLRIVTRLGRKFQLNINLTVSVRE